MKVKSIKKISIILAVAIILSFLSNGVSTSTRSLSDVEAGSMKQLKSSQYKKMIQGGLTEIEVRRLLGFLTNYQDNRKIKSLNKKNLNFLGRDVANGKQTMFFDIVYGFDKAKIIDNRRVYSITKTNKLLSSYSNFKFKKWTKYHFSNGELSTYTDDKYVHPMIGSEGYSAYIIIKTAKYNSQKIDITYELHDSLLEENLGAKKNLGNYKATFMKQKNGKYKLTTIKKTK